MLLKIVAYILIFALAPLIGGLVSHLVIIIFYPLKKILGQSFITFIGFISVGFASVWIGVQILKLFNLELSILMPLVILAVFIYHYTKDGYDKNTIIFGEIVGMFISYILFIK